MTKLKILILFTLIGISFFVFNQAKAAIAFDAMATSTVAGSITSTTFAHTVGTGANRALFVGVGYADSTQGITGVTYAGVALTQGAYSNAFTYGRSYIYYMVAPASGTNNVVVTYAGTLSADDRGGVGAVSYTGVAQTSPIDVTGTTSTDPGTSMTIALTTTSANDWIFNNFWWGGSGTNTVKYSETKRWQFPATGTNNGSADKATTAVGAYNTGWDGTVSNSGVMSAVAFKESVAGKRRIFISLENTLLKSVASLIKNTLWENI